jgi:membrane protein DedA with SNARE-associated domain
LPLPFPTSAFFAVAGVLDYPLQTFIIVVALCRALRYGLIAVIASHYGRRFVTGLRHPERHLGWAFGIIAGAVVATAATVVISKWIQSRRSAT